MRSENKHEIHASRAAKAPLAVAPIPGLSARGKDVGAPASFLFSSPALQNSAPFEPDSCCQSGVAKAAENWSARHADDQEAYLE